MRNRTGQQLRQAGQQLCVGRPQEDERGVQGSGVDDLLLRLGRTTPKSSRVWAPARKYEREAHVDEASTVPVSGHRIIHDQQGNT
ncbi:hypothetical protein [Streptomyces sp. NPDC057199]|uniref:hypothetical protein n=1 Tax=Streptomyces sp. NPDC057199 TaxID=3346047 RepID=UPI0036302389